MSNSISKSAQEALDKAKLAAVDPNSEEVEKAIETGFRINLEGPTNDQDLADLLSDAAGFLRALEVEEAGAFENKDITFKRLETGHYVVMSHRS